MTKLTFFTASGESFFLELPAEMTIADIKSILEADVSFVSLVSPRPPPFAPELTDCMISSMLYGIGPSAS